MNIKLVAVGLASFSVGAIIGVTFTKEVFFLALEKGLDADYKERGVHKKEFKEWLTQQEENVDMGDVDDE